MPLLDIKGLSVQFEAVRRIHAVEGVDLSVEPRTCVAIVGESGSGKSQLLLACTGLLAANGRATGSVCYDGLEILGPGDPAARIRGRGIGFVFQDASGSLTPHRRIGEQLVEAAMTVGGVTRRAALIEAGRMLERVRLPDPHLCLARYPHELSGGMRQRVAIAAALMPRPRLLFADEPTTALDVTVQAEVMALLGDLHREFGMAMLLVTHDLGVVAGLADRIAVMYAGRLVEVADAAPFLAGPRHPYSAALLAAVPTLDDAPGSEFRTIAGAPPRPGAILPGCRFEPRCQHAREHCRQQDPPLVARAGSALACHYPLIRGER